MNITDSAPQVPPPHNLGIFAETDNPASADLNGDATNPRWLLWEVWHGANSSMRPHDYIIWVNARWLDWSKATGKSLKGKSNATHAEFDQWLLLWVRSEIVRTVSVADEF